MFLTFPVQLQEKGHGVKHLDTWAMAGYGPCTQCNRCWSVCWDEAVMVLACIATGYIWKKFWCLFLACCICDMAFVGAPSPGSGHDYFDEIHSYISFLLEFNWHKGIEQNMEEICCSESKIYGAYLQAQVKNGRIIAPILQGIWLMGL